MPIHPRSAFHMLVVASMLSGAIAQPASPDTERSYRTATGLLNRGLNDLAAQEYRTFLEANPSSPKAPQAHYGLAVCLVRLGKHAEAIPHLDQITGLSKFEFAADALLLRAQCSMNANDPAAAIKQLKQLLKSHSAWERLDAATALLGEAHYAAGNMDAARATLNDALSKWPASTTSQRTEYLLALCEAATGNDDAAATRLARWRSAHPDSPLLNHATLVEAQCRHRTGDTQTAQSLYAATSRCGDSSLEPQAMLGLAQLLRAGGNPAQARQTLDDLKSRATEPTLATPIAIELARCHIDSGDFAKALALLEGLGAEPGHDRADEIAFWVGRCHLKLNHPKQALKVLRTAADAAPQSALHAELLLEQAAAHAAMDQHEEAARLCESVATSTDPTPAPATVARARLALASALHRAGRYQQSIDACTTYLDASDQAGPGKSDALLLIAENHYLLRAFEPAQKAYAAFLQSAPQHTHAWRAGIRRGLCLAQLQQTANAAAALEPLLDTPGEADPELIRVACTTMGELAFAAGDWPNAQKWLGRAVKDAGPEADAARLKLGLSFLRTANRNEALTAFNTIQVTDPPSDAAIQATFERGQVLVELGKPDEAKLAFERAIALESKSSSPRFRQHAFRHLAAIASAQGRTADAAGYLEQIAASPGGDENAQNAALDRATLLLGQGDYAKAAAACASFITANPRHPKLPQARAQHAIALSRLGKLDEALKAFEALADDQTSLEPALAAAATYERAWVLSQTKQTTQAAAAYLALLNTKPEPRIESHAALDLAQLKIATNDFTGAIPLLERAQTAAQSSDAPSPFIARCTYLKGVCQWRTGHAAQAAQTLTDFEKNFPESELNDSAAVTLGEALLASNQSAQAVKVLARVAENAKQAPMQSAALLRLGEAAAAASDWPSSERAFARHRELFEDSDQWFRAAFGLGFALENAGKREAAIAAYRTVVAGHDGPTAARAQFQIGECLYGLGKLDEAVAELLKVDILYQYPQWSAPALYEAGRCLIEQKKHAQGIKQFEEVLKRFPDSQWATPAREAAAAARPAALPGRDQSSSTPPARSTPNK